MLLHLLVTCPLPRAPAWITALAIGSSTFSARAKAAAQESGATVPLGAHATAIYEAFNEAGNGGKDFGAVFTTL
jgi:hypothetical protein